MGLRIGVVCEGSHDFLVLKAIVSSICTENKIKLDEFAPIQPKLSATFTQEGGGGWARVKSWCEQGNGTFHRTFLDQPIFTSSQVYDLLFIHIDGDVVDLCDHHPLAGLSAASLSPDKIVSHLENALIDTWMKVREEHIDRVVACIPIRHLEAWLLAALAPQLGLELQDTKDVFRTAMVGKYSEKAQELYEGAALDACQNLASMRANCASYANFETKFVTAAS